MSNIVKFSDTIKGVAENLEERLTRFKANNDTLASKKFQFVKEVKFLWMHITKDGCAPDPNLMEAIEQFPRPETKSKVRQLLGLCQQFSQWMLDMASATVNMRLLLRKSTAFVWTAECQEEFTQM